MAVETDAQGRYRLTGLQPATYVIAALGWRFDLATLDRASARQGPVVDGPDGLRTALRTTYHPNHTLAARAAEVVVGAGEISNVDIDMQRERVVSFGVRFVASEGAPSIRSTFALARLRPRADADQFGERNVIRGGAGGDGVTTFTDVGIGAYTLSYSSPLGWVTTPIDVDSALAARATPLELTLRPLMTVSGRVDFRPTRVAASPDALSAMVVSLNLSPIASGPVLRSPVAADGSFSIPRIPGGRYALALAPGSPWIVVSSMVGQTDTLDDPVTIESDISEARLVVTDRDTVVQGRVTAVDGGDVSGGTAVIFSTDRRYWRAGATRRVRLMSLAPGGGFNIDGLPPGRYYAAAFPPGARINNTTLAAATASATEFELAIGEMKQVPVILRR